MSLNFARRDTFLGRTDQYLTSALSGYAVFDPLRDYFSVHHRDDTVTRLKRYHRHWRFYNGQHYILPQHGGDNKLTTNYCRAIVNKSCDWLMGKGFTVKAAEGNARVAELLQRLWRMNNQEYVAWRAAMIGGVTGDSYFFVTVPWLDPHGRPIPPEQQSIQVQALNAAYVHPKFASSEDRTVIEVLIQYPIDAKKFAGLMQTVPKNRDLAVYSQYISGSQIREFVNEEEMPGSPRPNPLGFVPLVHAQNMPHPGFFGLSDLDDILRLNEEYNEVAESIRKIIKYHAEPTTLIFGAKISSLERGANKVWSNLPVDARVENLALDASLLEANNYRDSVKLAIHELSNTPESSLGQMQAISNTSDAALQTQYLPLFEKTQRKYITYGTALAEVNKIMLMYLQGYFGIDLYEIADNPSQLYDTEISFPSPLPQDKAQVINDEIMKLDHDLQSEAGALEEIYGKRSTSKAIEITADARKDMMKDAEAMSAGEGGLPNVAVLGVGSVGMIDGVAEAFSAQDAALAEAEQERARLLAEAEAEEAAALEAEEEAELVEE